MSRISEAWPLGTVGWKSVLSALALVGLLQALSGCAWLQEQQRQWIYRPTPSGVDDRTPPQGARFYDLSLPAGATEDSPDHHIRVWWWPQAQVDAPALLYLHGTFRNLSGNRRKIEALHAAGFSVLAVDYRGWGDSSPITPSQASIVTDAQRAWGELQRLQPVAARRVIYGHSMGSAVAVTLASQAHGAEAGGLILESAFTSFAEVAAQAGFWGRVLHAVSAERFDSLGRMEAVRWPLLMMHGSHDDTIPIALGRQLFAHAHSPKYWLEVPGAGHSDIDLVAPALYRQTLQAFARTQLDAHFDLGKPPSLAAPP